MLISPALLKILGVLSLYLTLFCTTISSTPLSFGMVLRYLLWFEGNVCTFHSHSHRYLWTPFINMPDPLPLTSLSLCSSFTLVHVTIPSSARTFMTTTIWSADHTAHNNCITTVLRGDHIAVICPPALAALPWVRIATFFAHLSSILEAFTYRI